MRLLGIPLALLVALGGCKPENATLDVRSVRTLVVDPKPIADDRQAVGEVKPRYESDLSFRVAGKVLARRVDVGASVRQGDTLATLDTQDFQNRLRSAEAEVASADAVLVEARGDEARKAKLLTDGWTPQGDLRHGAAQSAFRRGQAHFCQGQSRPDPRPAPLHRAQGRVRRCDHRRRRRAGSERQCRPDGGEARPTGRQGRRLQHRRDRLHGSATRAASIPKSSSGRCPTRNCASNGIVREISPVADSTTRTYTVKVTLKNPPPQLRFGMSIAGRLKRKL